MLQVKNVTQIAITLPSITTAENGNCRNPNALVNHCSA
jgi:hypothetical protein